MSRKPDVLGITFVLGLNLAVGVAAGLPESTKAWMRGESIYHIPNTEQGPTNVRSGQYIIISDRDNSPKINYVDNRLPMIMKVTSVATAELGYSTLATTIHTHYLRPPLFLSADPLTEQSKYENILKQPEVIKFLGKNGITIDNKL